MENEKIYNTKTLGELLFVHYKTVAKYCREGEIKAYQKFRRWYILHSDVIDFIKTKDLESDT